MLSIHIENSDLWDEDNENFITIEEQTIHLEHSLLAISKWESIWKKPFMSNDNKTAEELISYIKCMCIEDVNDVIVNNLSSANIDTILKYIETDQTATTIYNRCNSVSKQKIITSELLYYYMSQAQIPFTCETWHLSRLLMLLDIASVEGNPDNKMSKKETAEYYRALNAARRKKR